MTQQDLFQTATSLQPDIPASHLVRPGSDEARKMTAISGRKYFPLCKQSDQLGAFSRMFMVTSQWASTRCYLTWKPKATPAGRLLFQLAPSMPHTEDLESGFWATPRTTDTNSGRTLDEKGRRISKSSDLVFGANLADQVKMWPTPTATERSGINPKTGKGAGLSKTVQMWPTPTTRDHKGGYLGGRMRNGKVSMDTLDVAVQYTDNQQKNGGQLNPQWVEWLMGYPEGWTDLKD